MKLAGPRPAGPGFNWRAGVTNFISRRLTLRRRRPKLVKKTIGLEPDQLQQLRAIARARGGWGKEREWAELVRISIDIIIHAHEKTDAS